MPHITENSITYWDRTFVRQTSGKNKMIFAVDTDAVLLYGGTQLLNATFNEASQKPSYLLKQ